MLTITTKYRGPTNTLGSRIIASKEKGVKLSLPLDCSLSNYENHVNAARALAIKLGYKGRLVVGEHAQGYVFVCATAVAIDV